MRVSNGSFHMKPTKTKLNLWRKVESILNNAMTMSFSILAASCKILNIINLMVRELEPLQNNTFASTARTRWLRWIWAETSLISNWMTTQDSVTDPQLLQGFFFLNEEKPQLRLWRFSDFSLFPFSSGEEERIVSVGVRGDGVWSNWKIETESYQYDPVPSALNSI